MDGQGTEQSAGEERPFRLWTYRRRFTVEGVRGELLFASTMAGGRSRLLLDGREMDTDSTPAVGAEAVRNHRLHARLPDGRTLEVEAGYYNWWNVAVAVRVDGRLVHESHPGRRIAMPKAARAMLVEAESGAKPPADYQPGQMRRNKVPILVDIGSALLFFVVAKLTDLTTAALVGAGAGLALVVAQRFTRTDLLGGLALFGILMLLVSAGLAILFQDEDAIKLRSTVVGLIGAGFFLTDALRGGKWLGRGLARYMPYNDMDTGRLALGMGVTGLVMAGLNLVVARLASTDTWLFYTTFGDMLLAFTMATFVIQWSRRRRQV